MRKIRENLLVAKGDQSLFAGGQSVFNSDGTTAVKSGQLVVWDPITATSVDSTVTCSDYDRLVFSQGQKDGTLRSCFGDVLYGCDVKAVRAQAPACGLPDIWDLYIDSTINCNDQFSVTITVRDDDTLNLFPWNKRETYTYTVDTRDCACTDCETGFDAAKLACKIRDQINNQGYNKLPVTSKGYFRNIPPSSTKFTAHVLYGGINSNKVYCINPVSGTCDDCLDADVLIKSFKFDTDNITVFTNTDNNDGDATLVEKLDSIVQQMNDALGKNGSVALTKSTGGCCPWRIEINSCFTDAALYSNTGASVALTACTLANDPFDTVTIENSCGTCAADETKDFTAGVRIIAKGIDYLKCDPMAPAPNPVAGIGLRELQVFPTKGFSCGKSFVVHFQEATLPENLGYHFQWKDFASSNGGRGRTHEPFVRQGYGPFGLPLGRGPEGAVLPVCKENYCSYTIEHAVPYRDQTVYGNQTHQRGTTIVLIPSGDTTTRTEFEALLNTYIPSCGCPVKTAVTCA